MESARIRPILQEGPFSGIGQKHRIALSDGVVWYEVSAGAELSCVYFPQNAVWVSHRRRFDGSRLLSGLVAPLLTLFIGLILMFGIPAIMSGGTETDPPDFVMIAFMVVLALSFLFTLAQCVRFLFRQRTTTLHAFTTDGDYAFEFWHPKSRTTELDGIVDALSVDEPAASASPAPDLQFLHDWSYTRPLRRAIIVTFAALFLIYGVLRVAERLMQNVGEGESLPTILAGIFLLAPAAGVASFFYSQYRLMKAEPAHSTALAHFIRRDYDIARRDTDRILDAQPDDLDAHLLAVHVRLRQGKPSEIAPFCQRIDELVPELGTEISARVVKIWADTPNAIAGSG